MATQQYNLNLKATLDSTQVQQELQRLRNQQINIQSGINTQGGQSPIQNSGQLNNLNQIGTVLQNLNQTISRLNAAINRFSSVAGTQGQVQYSKGNNGFIPFGSSGSGISIARDMEQYQLKKIVLGSSRVNKAMSAALDTMTPFERQLVHKRYGKNISNLGYNLFFGNSDEFHGGLRAYNTIFGQMPPNRYYQLNYNRWMAKKTGILNVDDNLRPQYVNALNDYLVEQDTYNARNKKNTRGYTRAARLFAGQYLMGQFDTIGESIGGRTGASISGGANAIQSGLMASSAVSMAFPTLGGVAAAGAGIGVAIANISETMLKYAQQLSKAQQESYSILMQAKQDIRESRERFQDVTYTKSLSQMTIPELRNEQKTAVENEKQKFDEWNKVLNQGDEDYKSSIKNYLNDIDNATSQTEKARIEQEYSDDVKRAAAKVREAENAWKKSVNKLDEVEKALDAAVKNEFETQAKKQSYRNSLTNIQSLNEWQNIRNESDQYVAEKRDAADTVLDKAYSDLMEHLAKEDISDEGLRKKAELEKDYSTALQNFNRYDTEYKGRKSAVDNINQNIASREIDRRVEDYRKEVRDNLESNNGYAENLLFNLPNRYSQIDNIKKNIDNLLAKAAAPTTTTNQRQEILKQISEQENIINETQQLKEIDKSNIVEVFQNMLQQLQPPSQERATSLAEYGYNMGEKNDDKARVETQIQYLRDQTTLQQDIKNILDDKLPSSGTFS